MHKQQIIDGEITVKVPPIKIQGIKTKLIPFILKSIEWNNEGYWIEPFLGSGVVAFNFLPKNAILCDNNIHIIKLFQDIQNGILSKKTFKEYIKIEAENLLTKGEPYYYKIRVRFNENPNSFDFLFLNRSCFNGIIRFNNKGKFNVPFCKKNNRFRDAYITKIANQIEYISKSLENKNWKFICQDWKETLSNVSKNDFVYLDPPYIGRHADYFNKWDVEQANLLANTVKNLPCGFAYSMWYKNKFRENSHIKEHFSDFKCLEYDHFYHVGAQESLRNSMIEGLIVNFK